MSEAGWRVRPATRGDATALALVGAATFLETFADILDGAAVLAHCRDANAPAAYAHYLESGAVAWLGETHKGAPVGFALLIAPELPQELVQPGDLELKRIYLLSRFHGIGLGAALMDAAVAEARARGAPRLLLGVYAHNARAIAFYRKQGFVPIGMRQYAVGAELYDDVVLARSLPN
ncbi:ribosomal protein S18 acetylase RimI-like enzyme [Sphingomonas naasensis]|uniref:GNAT family N-acetyltransferase n=1 Tax=Sphingomonas naasensis TaxID=1344951 RepID=A0A4S1W7P8_9SPHN|nr:GNAT family N-acetyltransferase [Sphingomonas naasensis]NIJ21315.1 ribosomal protein S18 acetylase RimI-like enzyme [Sphingomonas naasensis]TGX38749.1 GNAT family N-acetyltransferase [Sphingomonas naasensis]